MQHYESIDLNFFTTTPVRFVTDIDLDCTPELLFAVFEDADAWTQWVPAIKKVEWTSPKPFRVGTTRTVFLAGNMEGHEEFIAWDAGKHMAFKFVTGNAASMTAFGEDYRVTDLGNGRCHLTWTMAMKPAGISKVFMPLTKPVMGWYLRKLLRNLQTYIRENAARFATA